MLDFVWSGFNNSSHRNNNTPFTNPPPRQPINHQQQIFQAPRYYESNSISDNFISGNLFFPPVTLKYFDSNGNALPPKSIVRNIDGVKSINYSNSIYPSVEREDKNYIGRNIIFC